MTSYIIQHVIEQKCVYMSFDVAKSNRSLLHFPTLDISKRMHSVVRDGMNENRAYVCGATGTKQHSIEQKFLHVVINTVPVGIFTNIRTDQTL